MNWFEFSVAHHCYRKQLDGKVHRWVDRWLKCCISFTGCSLILPMNVVMSIAERYAFPEFFPNLKKKMIVNQLLIFTLSKEFPTVSYLSCWRSIRRYSFLHSDVWTVLTSFSRWGGTLIRKLHVDWLSCKIKSIYLGGVQVRSVEMVCAVLKFSRVYILAPPRWQIRRCSIFFQPRLCSYEAVQDRRVWSKFTVCLHLETYVSAKCKFEQS